jgi:hypothetical protein
MRNAEENFQHAGPVVMYQRWKRLLFLHWPCEPRIIQEKLPEGLIADPWQGDAWLGIICLAMRDVRPRFLPAVGGISNFLQLNVRTYVRDAAGRRGVWFFSLDCSQSLAASLARSLLGLPYYCADIRERPGNARESYYFHCQRRGSRAVEHYEYTRSGGLMPAATGTIEEFLLERYRLFAMHHRRLLSVEIRHRPFEIESAELRRWSTAPLEAAGFKMGAAAPVHAWYSPGAKVEVFAPRHL